MTESAESFELARLLHAIEHGEDPDNDLRWLVGSIQRLVERLDAVEGRCQP